MIRVPALCVVVLLALAGCGEPEHATEASGKAVSVSGVWARASSGEVGAAYFIIENSGPEADRLLGVTSPAAGRAEIHLTQMDDGVARMRKTDAVTLPAGGTVKLEPGGYHVMLMGLTDGLKEGGEIELTLTFEKAGETTVIGKIMAPGANGPAKHTH